MADVQTPNEDGASPLMLACQAEQLEQVKALLKKKPDLKAKDKSGKTALHYCVENDNADILEFLLETEKSLLDLVDREGYSALQLAVIAGNEPIVSSLLKQGSDIASTDNDGHTCVHWATVCGHVDMLEILAKEKSANLATPDVHKAFPLHYAAQMCGNSEEGVDPETGLKVLQKLIEHKVPVDSLDQDQRQPLLWAASSGSHEACKALVDHGAKVDAADKDGLAALHCAASRGHDKCIQVLIDSGTPVNIEDRNGCTSLFYAVTLEQLECARLLLQLSADPDHADARGRSPGHCAAGKGSIPALELLDEKKADFWVKNKKGEYPLHEAALAKHKDVVEFLLARLPKDDNSINEGNQDGRTCLHIAAIQNNVELCKALVKKEADVNPLMRSKSQKLTPYDAALLKESKEVAEYIRSLGGKTSKEMADEKAKKEAEEKSKEEKDKKDSETAEGEGGEDKDNEEGKVNGEHGDGQKEDGNKDGNDDAKKKKVPTATLR